MPAADQEEIKRQVEELVAAGRIRPSASPFGASAMLRDKKDKSRRMVIDYRALNKLTRKDKYPLPRIDEMLDKLATGKYFTKMDLSSGFHQIRIRKGDEPKTAFQTRYGSFEWTVMPFGLTNAPATFQRTMDMTFSDMIDYTDIYVDDIVVYSESLADHLVHLRKVLQRLREHQLFVKLKKCSFAQSEIEFVGFIVGRKGIRPVPVKLQTISDWPVPKNAKHVRSFLSLCCFYH